MAAHFTLRFAVLAALLASTANAFIWLMIMFGPTGGVFNLKGTITEHGKPVPALISLDVMYLTDDGDEVPLTIVQTKSLSRYDLHLSGQVLRDDRISNKTAILRAQSLSVSGKSASVKIEWKENVLTYENNLELDSYHGGRRPGSISYDDY